MTQRSGYIRGTGLLAVVLAVGGCQEKTASPQAAAASAGRSQAMLIVPTSALRDRATVAMSAQHYFTPAGASAADLLLELRTRGQATAGDEAAITELTPYLVIAVEQAIERSRQDEAVRLLDLLSRIDARAPSISRLRMRVDALHDAAALQKSFADSVKPSEADAVIVASASRPSPSPSPAIAAVPPSAASIASETRVEARPPRDGRTQQSSVAASSEPSVGTATTPRELIVQAAPVRTAPALQLVRDAEPRYPARALTRRVEGRVELSFTVLPDGSVSDVQVVQAEPAGVFDRSAVDAAQRWRFAPIPASAVTTRTLRFTPPQS